MGNYFSIIENSTTNGVGLRTSIFLSGCHLRCKGCFNKDAWDFNSGKPIDRVFFKKIGETLSNDYTDGITILGGEPLDQFNIESTLSIIRYVRNKFPNKTIWLYTGYTIDELKNRDFFEEVIDGIDVLVDGPWRQELWDVKLNYRGSSNQIIWDKDEHGKLKHSELN